MGTRDNFLLETNFDEDGPLTTVSPTGERGNQPQQNNGTDLNRVPRQYRSTHSVDRYSDTTLHGVPKQGDGRTFFLLLVSHLFFLISHHFAPLCRYCFIHYLTVCVIFIFVIVSVISVVISQHTSRQSMDCNKHTHSLNYNSQTVTLRLYGHGAPRCDVESFAEKIVEIFSIDSVHRLEIVHGYEK